LRELSLVFLKVFDDLGTPLLLDVNNMLAPQAYLRISSIGINDPMGYVIGVILVLTSIAAVWVAKLALGGKDYSMLQKGGGGMVKRNFFTTSETFSLSCSFSYFIFSFITPYCFGSFVIWNYLVF